MQEYNDILGDIVKASRKHSELTIEEVAELAGVTERYLYRIENEGKKPSFDVLCKLIRILSIPSDSIFYPEIKGKDPEMEELIHMFYMCDARARQIVRATLKAALSSQRPGLCEYE